MLESYNSYYWDVETKGWIDAGEGSLYYSPYNINSAIATSSIKKMQVYPNPAVNYVSVDMEKAGPCLFELYDVAGRKVLSQNISNNRVDLLNTGKGFYFYNITIEGRKFSGKLIVE